MMREKIIKALEFNKKAYDAVKKGYERGMSEKDIKEIILSACSAADDFSGDIVGGARTSLIEGDAADYILKDGDCLILDLQFNSEGVWTDTTRTFFIGKPTEVQKEAYTLCQKAKQAGEAALKSGVRAYSVYNAVRNAFSPFEEKFPHHAGHLFGKDKLMQPQFFPERKEALRKNDFVTLEPGIYFDANFGIRIEDNYQITEDGFINLFDYPTEIEYFIL